MAYKEKLRVITLQAGSDLSAKQYYCVALQSDQQLDLAGDGGVVTGILQNKPDAAGRPAEVAISGSVSKAELGGIVATGAIVASDASGAVVTAATNDVVLGVCVQGGASGAVGAVLINGGGLAA